MAKTTKKGKGLTNNQTAAIIIGIILIGGLAFYLLTRKPEEEEQEEQVILDKVFNNLLFKTGKSEILSSSFTSLDELANHLITVNEKRPLILERKLDIIGHTDSQGGEDYNLKLSEDRANAVKTYLVGKGVTSDINAIGKGELEPVADNSTAEGRKKNRRVEFKIK